MSRYIRPKRPGAAVFFTLALAERGSDLLVRQVDLLRDVARRTRADKPFAINAWVVLPDHMHFVWTLPEGDADYSNRVGMLKARFTRALTGGIWAPRRVGFHPTGDEGHDGSGVEPHPTGLSHSKMAKQDGRVWQRRF